jgi:hypothetical protein
MTKGQTFAAAACALVAAGASAVHASPAGAACTPERAPAAYSASVARAVVSNRDVWGERLLHAPGGPSLAPALRLLGPLTRGLQWEGRPLTSGGVYYLPFSFPFTPKGSTVFALHVADGSEIFTRRVGGPSLSVDVGDGSERFGSCATRRGPAHLVDGYLPILQTSYVDARGVRYREESFVGRQGGRLGARSVISFVRLDVDARDAHRGATVRLIPSQRLVRSGADRLSLGSRTRLVVSRGAQLAGGAATYTVPPGARRTVYAAWLHAPTLAPSVRANAATYRRARRTVAAFWRAKLADGAGIHVPEPAVQHAIRGVLTQLIAYGWRYSIGNPYEELSYQESLDGAEVAAQLGYPKIARSILEVALHRMRRRPWRFTAARASHLLSTSALYVRLTDDRDFLRQATPQLSHLVDRISWRQSEGGSLLPEPLSTDLENRAVTSVNGQIAAVQGLLALARVWRSNGYAREAARAAGLALSIDRVLRPAVTRASVRLTDGSLFVPDQLPQRPFRRLTASKDGSYWNLIMPSAFASGWFPARSPTTVGILDYLLGHGSRLLGVPRTYARSVYGNRPGAGIAPVYALGISRFLAAEDKPGLLDVGLYGMLAAGMTRGTYVSGEAVSLIPLEGAYERAMFMPPNTGANASFLGTVRELLVHERLGARGAPTGVDLAFATPTAWLADGKKIDVRHAPTSFGKVSYSLARHGLSIIGRLDLPPGCRCRLRLRIPSGLRVASVTVGAARLRVRPGGTIDLGKRQGSVDLRARLIHVAAGGSGWRAERPLPVERGEVAAAIWNGRITIAGGFVADGSSSPRVDAYSPATKQWTRLPDLPLGVNHTLSAAGGGRLFVAGGYTAAGRSRRAWALSGGRWRPLPQLPYGLAAGGAAVLRGKLYLVAGVAGPPDRSALVRRMLVLDLSHPQRWRFAPAPTPREHLAVTVAAGRIYALGGRTAGYDTNVAVVESWRPGERTWRRERPLPEPRGGTGAAAVGNVIVSAGGEAPSGTIASVYAYDVSRRAWRRLPDLPTPRHGLGVAAVAGRVYVVAGGRVPGLAVSGASESIATD